MINFIEHTQTGYAMRTWDNARLSDLTVAFAIDFTTPGEILTRKAAYGKYFKVKLRNPEHCYLYNQEYRELLNLIISKKVTKINIAGNGVYTLKDFFTQETLNGTIYGFLKAVFERVIQQGEPPITTIRSGGQTGADQAGLLAGDKLGLETICLAPKNWMFRDITGRDICSENLFLKRFGPQYDITDIL